MENYKKYNKKADWTTVRITHPVSAQINELRTHLLLAKKELVIDHMLRFCIQYFDHYKKLPDIKDIEMTSQLIKN